MNASLMIAPRLRPNGKTRWHGAMECPRLPARHPIRSSSQQPCGILEWMHWQPDSGPSSKASLMNVCNSSSSSTTADENQPSYCSNNRALGPDGSRVSPITAEGTPWIITCATATRAGSTEHPFYRCSTLRRAQTAGAGSRLLMVASALKESKGFISMPLPMSSMTFGPAMPPSCTRTVMFRCDSDGLISWIRDCTEPGCSRPSGSQTIWPRSRCRDWSA